MRLVVLSLLMMVSGCRPAAVADFRPLAAAVFALKTEVPPAPLRLRGEISRQSEKINQPGQRVQCLVFSTYPCPPCEVLKQDLQQVLVPLGWRIGSAPDQTIRLIDSTHSEGRDMAERFRVQQFPTAVILVEGKETDRIVGRVSAAELSWRISQRFSP